MQTTKLIFMVMIGLAMIEISIGQSLHAATSPKAQKTSLASTKHTKSPASTSAKSAQLMHGVASVYANKFTGRKTSSGQKFCQEKLTAAHRSLPFGTKVLVTNVRNSKSVEVSINDRGPWRSGRVIDLSAAAAVKIGMKKTGNSLVKLEVVSDGSAKNHEG